MPLTEVEPDQSAKQNKKMKNDAVRQFYIEKLEVYPSFLVAVGPSWVIQLWGKGGGAYPWPLRVVTWVCVYVLLFPFLVHLSRYLLSKGIL